MPVLKPLILICELCQKVSDEPAMMRDNGGFKRVSPPPGWLIYVANGQGTLDDLAFCPLALCREKAREILKASMGTNKTNFYTTAEGDELPPEEESGFMHVSSQPFQD